MAKLTVDLLTGNIYLFSGNFSGSGSTPTSGSTYPEVNLYSNLPSPSSHSGEIYVVRSASGSYVLNRRDAGLYFSTGTIWRRLGDTPSYFNSDNFQVYDGTDNTKGLEFVTSGISTGTFRQLKIQDKDGTIAYLTDIGDKLDTAIFSAYTATTAPSTFLAISDFNTYSATTYSLILGKQDKLTAGTGIKIDSGNTISIDTPTALLLTDDTGGQNVNSIQSVAINWTNQIFSGTSLSYTGGSRIYIEEDGVYGISYVLNVNGSDNSETNIGTLIRKNGDTDITPMSTTTVTLSFKNDSGTNTMPEYHVSLNNGDYVELVGFRIGNKGNVFTVEDGSWIKMKKIIQ